MKKWILGLMLAFISIISINGQTIVDNGSWKDNVYVGAQFGATMWNNVNAWNFFSKNINDSWTENQVLQSSVYVGKMFTPYIGTELDFKGSWHTQGKALDNSVLSGNFVFNVSNLIWGIKEDRPVNFEVLLGCGWGHDYNTTGNALVASGAIRSNIRVTNNWYVTVTPQYNYIPKGFSVPIHIQTVDLMVGVKYTIPTKRSGFERCRLYDQEQIDYLHTELARLNKRLEEKPTKVEVVKNIVEYVQKDNTFYVVFDKGSDTVDNITNTANALKTTEGKICIIGETSPEGSPYYNEKLGIRRAMAVKDALVVAGVDSNRIEILTDYEYQRRATIFVEK